MAKLNVGRVVWLGVTARNLEAQKKFYRDVMDFDEIESGDGWAHLDMGRPHLLELIEISKEPPDHKAGFRPAFQVRDIEAARKELIARGAKPVGEIEGGVKYGGRWCAFKDPEGNYFEIKQIISRPSVKRPASGGLKSKKKP